MAEARSRGLIALALAAVLVLALGVASASARTIESHEFADSFDGHDALGVPSPTFSTDLEKLDVDKASGAVLVATVDGRIYRFDGAGVSQPFSGLGANSVISGNSPGSFGDLEIDNSGTATQGRFYAFAEAQTVQAYEASGLKSTSKQLEGDYCGASISADGHFWLSVYNNGFFEHTPTLELTGNSVHPSISQMCDMDMDPQGFFYIHSPYTSGPVYKFSPTGEALGQFDGGPSQTVAIDSSNSDVYVDDGSEINHYTAAGQLLESFGDNSGSYEGISNSRGIGVNPTNHVVYVANNNGGARTVDRFTQSPTGSYVVPDATTKQATEVTRLSAKANGVVNPDGVATTSCKFEYGADYKYAGGSVSCAEGQVFTGSNDNTVSAVLAGLTQATAYHYRLTVENANGKKTYGLDQTFTTVGAVKDVLTKPATEVTRTSATLHGSFDGEGFDTNYYFEYGTSQSYTDKVPLPAPPGEDVGTVGAYDASEAISGLSVETVYHFRLVAENSFGRTNGPDLTFETPKAVTNLTTEAATDIEPDSADLNASFLGDGLDVEYFFEYGASANYGTKTPTEKLVAPSGQTAVPPVHIDGLQPLHTYHYRVVASNSTGIAYGADRTLNTVSAPVIVGLTSAGVTAVSADLEATINPHGAETTYYFEYGPTISYGTTIPVPPGTLAPSETDEPVTVHLEELNGGVYHFRLVASSKYGTTESTDQTFNFYPPQCPNSTVRQQTGANNLPDCRAYELVSPEDAGTTIIFPANAPFSPTATSPSRLAFVGAFGTIPNTGDPLNNIGDLYVATRTIEGWKTKYVGLPASEAAMVGGPPWTYGGGGFTDKWEIDVLTNPDMSAIVSWDDGYYDCSGEPGDPCQTFGSGPGTSSSEAPYVWNSTTGKQADRWPTNVGTVPGGEEFEGRTAASADLGHFVFTSNIPFAPGGLPGDMYDNDTSTGSLDIVSLNAKGEHIQATPIELSDDGSHILMTVGGDKNSGHGPTTGPGELYMRVNDERTYEIVPGKAVKFVDMTPDASKVFFISEEDLTSDGSDTDTSKDLYMWDEANAESGELTLISKGNDASSGNTDACNAFAWTNKCNILPVAFDGYTNAQAGVGGSPYSDNVLAPETGEIYFLSPELLHGGNGVPDFENLYLYRDGKLQFVAALDPASEACTFNVNAPGCAENAVARMETTPNNTYMAFLTASKVTGYDNAGHTEMYLYRPAADELTCVSCLPTGEPPTGDVTTSHNGRFLTDDGRTFFETKDAVVPQDTNKARDVYEYVDGRPQLISSGTAAANEVFGVSGYGTMPGLVGVSADGTDVFFATYDVLVGQDRNGEAIKIYDARSGGGFEFTPPVPPCVAADECHGPSTEPPGPPPSGTGSNVGDSGNLPATKAGKGKNAKSGQKKKKKRKKMAQRKGGHRNG